MKEINSEIICSNTYFIVGKFEKNMKVKINDIRQCVYVTKHYCRKETMCFDKKNRNFETNIYRVNKHIKIIKIKDILSSSITVFILLF